MFDQIVKIDDLNVPTGHILELLEPGAVLCLFGPLGAGKSTLSKHLVEALGLGRGFSSPTFTYVNHYGTVWNKLSCDKIANCQVYHFDLYRIKNLEDLYSLELMGYFAQLTELCLVEWPELLISSGTLSGRPLITVKMEYLEESNLLDNARRIIIEKKVDSSCNLFDI